MGGQGQPAGTGGKADGDQLERSADVIFSPQPYDQSHAVRVASVIDSATESLDIAMYSYSDAGIAAALGRAVERGVRVRFMFDTGGDDARLAVEKRPGSKSGRLERIGVNVRYVNKIMHHKFMIVDGPRDDAERAATARLVTGSGNWSNGAATVYDENTLFLAGYPELALRLQQEFNVLWEHSRDFTLDAQLPYEKSTLAISDDDIPDEDGTEAFFTSANFSVSGTTFRVTGSQVMADELVAAIQGATSSIHIASGHLRSRPVAEALMAKAAAEPDLDIRVYLDGQEYISDWAHQDQLAELDDCLASAGDSDTARRRCLDKGFLYGYQAGTSGVGVRYKFYAYRWDNAYAKQMHHKYFVIDGATLYTGSYNLSDNAEHNTFENLLRFDGPEFSDLVAAYEDNFEDIWKAGEDEALYDQLLETVRDQSKDVPLVFEPMALDWDQIAALKEEILAACPAVNSSEYRTEPTKHQYCPRQ